MSVYKDVVRNTWYVKFQYKNWARERKWVTKRGFPTKRVATQWEREFELNQRENSDIPFDSFVQIYKRDRHPRIKESTFQTKENIIDTKIVPFFGKKPLCEITTLDIMQWQNSLLLYRDPDTKKAYSKSYLKTIHNQLSAILNHAVRFYKLKENPAALVGNMGTNKGIQMKFWTKEEYQRFAEYMMDDPVGYYAFQVLYWCGLREGEMLALTPSDIDFQNKTITVSKTLFRKDGQDIFTESKTPKSNRIITVPDFLLDELKDHLAQNPDMKPNDRIFPLSKTYLHYKMNRGCEATSLTRIRIHDLRHSHVSLLIDLGFSAVAIAERMGHESIDITYRYFLFESVEWLHPKYDLSTASYASKNVLHIYAGVEGSGKSSILGIFKNIYKDVMETSLTEEADIQYIREKRELGWYIDMLYVGLDTVDEHLARIDNRVKKGGSAVDPLEVQEQFENRWKVLKQVLPLCDEVSFYDNTNTTCCVATYRNNKMYLRPEGEACIWLHEWIHNAHDLLLIEENAAGGNYWIGAPN